MILKKKVCLSILAVIGSLNSMVYAEDITLITEDFPAEAEKVAENKVGGIGGEIVSKALEAKHMTYKMSWVPWKRAQADTLINADKKSFIIPLTRNKERESSYNWVSKIYDADTAFINLRGENSINSFKEANGKRIGVLLGSSYETTLKDLQNGIVNSDIDSVPNDATNAKKLNGKKIGAWYSGVIGAFAIIQAEKIEVTKFQAGQTIDREENYIATSKSTPEELANKVKEAIEDFKKTGEYKILVKKYTGG